MPYDKGKGELVLQTSQELDEGDALLVGSGVGWMTILIEASFIADADGVTVVVFAMGTDLIDRTSGLDGAVATYYKVIAYAFPTADAVPEVYLTC